MKKENGMPRYSEEFKEQIVRKMMPPNALSVAQVSRDTGVSEQALYQWRNACRHGGQAVPADPANPEHWRGETKLAVVIETAALNTAELAEYSRRKGLYVEQIARWREAARTGTETARAMSGRARRELQQDRKKIRKLEQELRRKEKALAETAALLVLSKKVQAIWGEREGD